MEKRNDDIFEALYDELLTEAAILANEEICAELEIPDDIEFSKEHEQKMEKIIRRYERRERYKTYGKYARRCACILGAFIIVGSVSIGSVEAWRTRAVNFFFDKDNPNTTFRFTDGDNWYANEWLNFDYIPEDYAMTEDLSIRRGFTMVLFQNQHTGEQLTISIDEIDSVISIDTENAEIEDVKVNGQKGIYSSKERIHILLWNDEDYVYTIETEKDLGKEELIKIGENIH